MAKACGLRIGQRRFELFVLEGSPKKPKIVTSLAGELPPDELDPIGAAAHALKAAVKTHGIPTDNVGLVIDAGSAAFRSVNLPVTDASKIESVLKFEVESQLPQFSIDEVIVDFYVKELDATSSSLLVTAVPKAEIQAGIDVCNAAGLDPLEVEVETSALINAAASAGLCGIEVAQVLVHVGEESTAVAVVDSGRVCEMRVIQAGALTYTPPATLPQPPEGAEEGEDSDLDGGDGESAERREEIDSNLDGGPPELQRLEEIVGRIRRELARTVSATRTASELSGIYVTGFILPGLVDEDILGVPVEALEEFPIDHLEGDVHVEYRSGAVAYGAAIRQLGGGLIIANLRREELKFSGVLERLELSLAVMCLLITTFLGVWFMFLEKERASIDRDLRFMLDSSINYMLGTPKKGIPGNLEYPPESLKSYVQKYTDEIPGSDPPRYREDPNRNRYEQLVFIKNSLLANQRELQKQLGHDSELVQPQSALKGLTLVLDLMANAEGRYGRTAFHSLGANYRPASSRQGDLVIVELEVAFFAENTIQGSRNYEEFFSDLEKQPWHLQHDYSRSDPITGGESGVFLPSVTIHVDVSKAEEATP